MNLKRSLGFALRWCASSALLVACWLLWLVLLVGLGLQAWFVAHRELELPAFVLRSLERRLAASEITARFGHASFDPAGRVLFKQVRLYGADQSTPLVSIRAAFASLEFFPLLVGDVRVHEVRLTGVDLQVPAMVSPSGTDEAVVSDLDGVFQAKGSDYRIATCTFRIAGVPVASHGRFHLPTAIRARPGSMPVLELVIERFLKAGRKLVALRPHIEALENPRLQLTLVPSADSGALVETEILVDASRPEAPFQVKSGRARAVFPLLGEAPVTAEVAVEAEQVAWREQVRATRLRFTLSGSFIPDGYAFTPQTVRLTAAEGAVLGIPLVAPVADLTVKEWPRIRGEVRLQAGGSPLAAHAAVDTRLGEATIDLSTSLGPELLRLAADRFGVTATKWVTLGEPARLRARVALAAGWKLARAEGDLSVRHAIAHEVAIDAAGGHFAYAGHGLEVSDVTLINGANAAYGSYAMNTATKQYRFLLQGHLRPLDISGWFTEWWPRFWQGFDFAAAAPVANVDVAGRWGTAEESVVFVQAEAAHPLIREVPFDRVRTTLFFRPDFFEVSTFNAERAGHAAQGSFTVAVDPARSAYRTLDFNAASDLDVSECARLYGPAGTALAAAFQFSEPPTVRVAGHFDGPAAPGGARTQLHATVAASHRSTVHGFPLDTMKFSADYHDGDLDLRDIDAGIAGGAATGSARIEGPPEKRTVALDAKLVGADLARVVTLVGELQSAGKPSGSERPGERLLRRAASSRLDGRIAASGRLGEPYSFHGDGQLAVSGQELGEIHVFGLLSELLSKTLLNFTSLRLNNAQANFRVDGNKLVFTQVKLMGPRASIDAKGEYLLETKRLDFNARVYPLQESKYVVADALGALLTPLSNVLELKLTGPLEKPSWAFAYGPTSLLRAITHPANNGPGGPGGNPAPAPAPKGDGSVAP